LKGKAWREAGDEVKAEWMCYETEKRMGGVGWEDGSR